MKFALSWIEEWVDLKGLTPEEIGDALTLGGVEVDKIEPAPLAFSGVVVGKVISAEKHPDADRLRVARVSDGTEEFQVVCAASNCRAGLITAFAKAGAVVGETKIKKGKMRGIESHGMLCAADELGLGEASEGIMELDATLGIDLSALYGDTIFEVSLTPNLGHCMSVIGIARELSALLERPMKAHEIGVDAHEQASLGLCIESDQCPAYAYRIIQGVKVGPSPEWLATRLESVGVRSVNNIVDITNFVMLERGQPLHAFDAALIENGEIRVRTDQGGAKFTTLDGQERIVPEGAVMICDGKKPIAIGGVMGGANSEVSDKTRDIVLEAALFAGPSVRKTSKALTLRTDASARFEKGVDPMGLEMALDRAAELIGGKVGSIVSQAKVPYKPKEVELRLSKVNSLLGSQLSLGDVEQILTSLELTVRSDSTEKFTVGIPSFRLDVNSEVDLIEEVGRIYGYGNLPKRAMRIPPSSVQHSAMYLLEERVREVCTGEGLLEFITCNLIGPKDMKFISDENELLRVLHPSSVDQSILRPTLLPSMMQSVAHNFDHQNHTINAFEVGRTHCKQGEMTCVGILLTGNASPHHIDPKTRSVDFYDLSGHVENLFAGLGIDHICIQREAQGLFHPGRCAKVSHGDFELGVIGQFHPKLTKADVYFAQINLSEVIKLWSPLAQNQLVPLPMYPGSQRDWTVQLPEAVAIAEVLCDIRQMRSQLLEDVFLLDLFRKEAGLKAATFRFSYRHAKKTLPSEAVDREHDRLVGALEKNLQK